MAQALLKELFTYTDWARDKVYQLVTGLTDAQLDRPFEMGSGTIRKTLHHIWSAERIWLDRWSKEGQPTFVQPEAGLPTAALLERAKAAAVERDAFFAKKNEADLARPLTFTNMKSDTYSLPLGGQMLHVCNHGIHHRAQIVNMLRHVGGPVPMPGPDYIFFLMEQPASPSLELEAVRAYQAYSDWATRKLLGIAAGLSDAQLDRSFEMGIGTQRKTLAHLHGAEVWWHANWTRGPGMEFPPAEDKIAIADLSRRFDEAWSKRDRFVAGLKDADLTRMVEAKPRPDLTRVVSLGVSLVQLCCHATHHRAQMLNMLRHVGAATPGLDLVLWLRDQQPALPHREGIETGCLLGQ